MQRDPIPTRRRYASLPGSADALALAGLAAEGRPLAVICASAQDAQRLVDEVAWFAPALRVCMLPDWETLPYDQLSPHPDLVSERLASLYHLQRGEFDIAVVPAATALYRLAPPAYLAAHTFFLETGTRLDVEALRTQLVTAGYAHVTQVVAPGEYCVRGGLIDLFPMGSALPYRIELDDETIDTLRAFDVDSQRTLYAVKSVRLLPAREFPLDEAGRAHFRGRFRERFEGDPSKRRLYRDVSNGVPSAGVEYYLPLFFDSVATLFDYLPAGCMAVLHHDVAGAIDAFWADAGSRFRLLGGDAERPLLPPTELFLPAEAFYLALRAYPRVDLLAGPDGEPESLSTELVARAAPPVAVDRRAQDPLEALKRYLSSAALRVLLVAESAGRRETMSTYFGEYGILPAPCADFAAFRTGTMRLALGVAPLASGFELPAEGWCVLTEAELYAGTVRRRSRGKEKAATAEGMLRDLSELRIGDPVVHAQHGIGRYQGLASLDLGDGPAGQTSEFLLLTYDGGDKLYVPVSQLAVISRYSGAQADDAPLHKLGSGQWEKARARAAKQVRDTAAELLALYAKRAAREGHAFAVTAHDLEAFADGFGFEETQDQASAITAVVADMTSGKPMDRLICGDVGFGKTEVALRAAFTTAMEGKQVAIVVPTTLLARQHHQLFAQRFANFPVKVAQLSRLVTPAETKSTKEGLSSGAVDIVIGTHALLAKDVNFDRLGLLIVDEEQHFGVVHKEQLKALKSNMHVLTMTATPIPRTLQLALTGVREMSLITTPPVDRLAVRTFVLPQDRVVIMEAIKRELYRGGQVFYVTPRLAEIPRLEEFLREILPDLRIAIAHGQLPARQLETVISAFYDGAYDLLLSTNIIESGLDLPSVNTIIIHRADMFGLAQLYQLRGRIGRSKARGYAYLTLPPGQNLTPAAQRRLEVMQALDTLGAGFMLASHDLDIRGAGNLLGEEQSGHIREVGIELYQQMLEDAVSEARADGAAAPPAEGHFSPTIDVAIPVLIPADYVEDLGVRLSLYRRAGNLNEVAEIEDFAVELIDRFGAMPSEVENLLETVAIKRLCVDAGVERLEAGSKGAVITFHDDNFENVEGLVKFVTSQVGTARLRPDHKLVFSRSWEAAKDRLEGVRYLLGELAALVPAQ